MPKHEEPPRVVLICHERDRIDREALASWLASTLKLAGLIIIRDRPSRLWRAAQREMRRVGALRFADVLAFRAFQRLRLAGRDNAWKEAAIRRVRAQYPADLSGIPSVVVSSPNGTDAREFLQRLAPDIVIARCKVILRPDVFNLPRVGTFVLHPGVCPEYRNAHGCFWALVNRDMTRVGMTLLRVDAGIDTGPIYLQAGCDFDEVHESHSVIQYRVVLENLDAIGSVLTALCRGERVPTVPGEGRRSAVWGQPHLSAYMRWKRAARLDARSRDARRLPALS